MSKILTKAEFAKALGVSRPTVSSYCRRGMPQEADGTLDEDACREWIRQNIRSQSGMRGLGGRLLADDVDDDEFDTDHSAARLLKARAEKAELELERMKGGTEQEVKLKLIETIIHHLWWSFQGNSPHALTGAFLQNRWLDLKDGPSCARASSLILARDCTIMRQMATVVEQAISGNLTPVNGRRDLLVPWQAHQLEWAKEVGDVFQAAIDDSALLVVGKKDDRRVVEHVDSDGEIHTTTHGAADTD
jgi:hypothetical protein